MSEPLSASAQAILTALVDFYEAQGVSSAALNDPETGGLYEHKLAALMGWTGTPEAFTPAAAELVAAGYVTRTERLEGFPMLGIWPTPAGLAYTPAGA